MLRRKTNILRVEKDDIHATLSERTYQIYISRRNIFTIRIQNGYIYASCSERRYPCYMFRRKASTERHPRYMFKMKSSMIDVQKEDANAILSDGT